ncbi:interferon a3 [Xenopus laevis]|uniref:Interferon a3 n=1 Tax=Xenopus laevis TaxID=8355 RepID=A0A8J0U158_XENLA|nr:interferon a3 [Xenopus laevis]
MNHMMSRPLLLLLSLISIVHCRNCKWLHPKQEYLNIQILQTFSQLTPPKEFDIVCHDYPTAQPNLERLYNITQVEAAALAVREVLNETIRFYRKHHESMGCKQQAWERFQQLLYYQIHQLEGCVPETGENDLLKNKISEQFQQWEKNVAEQDKASCAWDFIQDEIRRNLHLALQLSSRLRRQHLL